MTENEFKELTEEEIVNEVRSIGKLLHNQNFHPGSILRIIGILNSNSYRHFIDNYNFTLDECLNLLNDSHENSVKFLQKYVANKEKSN